MFDFLRRMIVPIMMIALIGFLATIIFQWGMDITSRDQYVQQNLAAVINGEEVSWDQYNQIYSNLYSIESQNYDEEVPDNKVQELQQRAYNQILQEILMKQEAEKLNITVSNDEMYNYLRFSPPPDLQTVEYFQTNGQFDYNKYLSGLADPQFASFWNQYEPYLKNEIRKQKVQEAVVQSIFVTENEVRNEFLSRNEKVKVGIINVPHSRYNSIVSSLPDEELKTYYDANTDKYQKEPRAVLDIVMYDRLPTNKDWEVIKGRMVNIYDTISAGADFAEMAKIYSQDGSAASGGDLNWFNKGQMVPEFDSKVFSMDIGAVSEPIRTQFGWHIIKLHDRKTEKENGQDVQKAHASHILLRVNVTPESLDEYFANLEQLKTLAEDMSFNQAAEQMGLEVKRSNAFVKGGGVSYIGGNTTAINEFAFSNEVGTISNVIDNSNSIFITQIAEIKPAGIADFDEVKQEVRTHYSLELLTKICLDTAQVIYREINNGTDISKAASNHGAEYTESNDITRQSSIPGVGVNPVSLANAFKLKEVGEISKPFDYNRGSMILKLLSKQSADVSQFTAVKDSLKYELIVGKQQTVYRSWFNKLIRDSEITNNIQFGARRN